MNAEISIWQNIFSGAFQTRQKSSKISIFGLAKHPHTHCPHCVCVVKTLTFLRKLFSIEISISGWLLTLVLIFYRSECFLRWAFWGRWSVPHLCLVVLQDKTLFAKRKPFQFHFHFSHSLFLVVLQDKTLFTKRKSFHFLHISNSFPEERKKTVFSKHSNEVFTFLLFFHTLPLTMRDAICCSLNIWF